MFIKKLSAVGDTMVYCVPNERQSKLSNLV